MTFFAILIFYIPSAKSNLLLTLFSQNFFNTTSFFFLISGDFRGTKDSLKKLVNDERCQKPLLIDIWQFHQAERLYILRILKEILTQVCSPTTNVSTNSSKHSATFHDIFAKLDKDGQLKESLFDQFESLISAPIPSKKDKHFTKELIEAWAHFNLREQSELVQILLLYLHHEATSCDKSDIIRLLKLFTNHGFGSQKLAENVDKGLIESIGHLESILMVYLLDLPGLTSTAQGQADLDQHPIWKNPSLIQELDRCIGSSLGNLKPHGPPMLAWMLAHYIVEDQVTKHKSLGIPKGIFRATTTKAS
jgi:hypothetical protein